MDPKTEMELGRDDPKHIAPVRKIIAGNLGMQPDEITPAEEVADNMIKGETSDFLEAVAGVKPEEAAQNKIPDSSSGLNELGENLNALLPVGGNDEGNVRTASSKEVNEIEQERLEKMKAK